MRGRRHTRAIPPPSPDLDPLNTDGLAEQAEAQRDQAGAERRAQAEAQTARDAAWLSALGLTLPTELLTRALINSGAIIGYIYLLLRP